MSKFVKFKGIFWRVASMMVEPLDLGQAVDLDCRDFKGFPEKFLLVRWVEEFREAGQNLWLVANSRPLDIKDLSQNTRSKVRRGQRNFEIRPISREIVKNQGFEVQRKLAGLGKRRRMSQVEFVREIDRLPEGYEFLGIFERESGELAGYSQIFVGQKFVNLRVISILPEANRRYASYAFYFFVNQRYVKEQGRVVVLGLRSLVGRSNVQQFVVEKFGFERLYVKFRVCLSFWGKLAYAMIKPFRPILQKFRKIEVIRLIYAYLEFILLAKS